MKESLRALHRRSDGQSGGPLERILGNMTRAFHASFDEKALQWLAEHPSEDALVVAYQDTRC